MRNKELALDRLEKLALVTLLASVCVYSLIDGRHPWHEIAVSISGICTFLLLTSVAVRFIRALDQGLRQAAVMLVMAGVWAIGGTFIGMSNTSDSAVAFWLSWAMGAVGASLASLAIVKALRISWHLWWADRPTGSK